MRSRALPPAFRIAAGACCALLATTLATAAPDNAALNARDTCYSGVFLLVSRGSEEVQGQSVLEGIATAVKTAIPNSGGDEVVYPAWLSFWNSAPTGVTNAQQQLSDYYAACPSGKIVLMGYSQGSYVLATALAGGNFSGQTWEPLASDIGENIAAVVLFGNPARVLGQGTAALGTNCAVACTATGPLALDSPYNTTMAGYAGKTESWCDADDPVCCETGTNIEAHLSYWSDNTTDTVVHFVDSFVDSFIHGFIDSFHDRLIHRFVNRVVHSFVGSLIDRILRYFETTRLGQDNPLRNRLQQHRHCLTDECRQSNRIFDNRGHLQSVGTSLSASSRIAPCHVKPLDWLQGSGV